MARYKFEDIVINSTEKRMAIPGDEKTFVTPSDLVPHKLKITTWGMDKEIGDIRPVMHAGDVLFIRQDPEKHQVAIAPFDGLCTSYCSVYKARTEVILPDFLPYLVTSNIFINKVCSLSIGNKKKNVNWGELKNTVFTIPDIKTQQKYLPLIQEAEKLFYAYEQMEKDLEAALKSFYHEKIINHPENKKITLGELMFLQSKTTKLSANSERYITYEGLSQSKPYHNSPDKQTYAYPLRTGQIVAHKTNFCKGSICLVPPEYDHVFVSNHVQLFDISSEVLPDFLYRLITDSGFLSKLEKCDLTTDNWNMLFSKKHIFIPPLSAQKKYLEFREKTNKSLSNASKCKEQAYKTFQSVICSIIED